MPFENESKGSIDAIVVELKNGNVAFCVSPCYNKIYKCCSLEDETNVFARSSARWRGNPLPFSDRVRYRNVRRGTDCHVGLCTPRNDILIRYVVL